MAVGHPTTRLRLQLPRGPRVGHAVRHTARPTRSANWPDCQHRLAAAPQPRHRLTGTVIGADARNLCSRSPAKSGRHGAGAGGRCAGGIPAPSPCTCDHLLPEPGMTVPPGRGGGGSVREARQRAREPELLVGTAAESCPSILRAWDEDLQMCAAVSRYKGGAQGAAFVCEAVVVRVVDDQPLGAALSPRMQPKHRVASRSTHCGQGTVCAAARGADTWCRHGGARSRKRGARLASLTCPCATCRRAQLSRQSRVVPGARLARAQSNQAGVRRARGAARHVPGAVVFLAHVPLAVYHLKPGRTQRPRATDGGDLDGPCPPLSSLRGNVEMVCRMTGIWCWTQ